MKNWNRIRKMGACLLAVALLSLAGITGAETVEIAQAKGAEPQTVRVLLTKLGGVDRVDATLNGAYSTALGDTTLMFGRGSDLAVLVRNNRLYVYYAGLSMDAGEDFTLTRHPVEDGGVNGIQFANNAAMYEGNLRFQLLEGKLRLILTLPVEDYVKGVVPYEMSESFPLEALKAQAVAARTYAVSRAESKTKQDYDVVDNTNDQVYRGRRDDYQKAAQAVDDTAGICGFYQNHLATCYYGASNGGQTELGEHVWNDNRDYGYLDMRDDPYDLENPQSKVQSVTLPKTCAAVEDAPYSLRALLSEQLRDTLVKSGYDPAPESLRIDSVTAVTVDTPMFKAPSRLYTMLHITFAYSARTRSQVAVQPTPSWTDNDQEVSLFTAAPMADSSLSGMTNGDTVPPSPTQTATPTPAPSYGPFVAADKPITLDIPIFPTVEKLLSLGINSDDNEMVSVEEAADSFVISSRRYGHGVGMSQRGAEWMAYRYQKTYTEILSFYYPGMTLMRYTVTPPALPTVAPQLMETAGPVPTPTPRPTLMPVTQTLPAGAWYAAVTGIDDDSSLNLREQPDTSGTVLLKLYKNQQLIVLEECPQEGWVRVRTDAIEGYVMEKFLTQEPKP